MAKGRTRRKRSVKPRRKTPTTRRATPARARRPEEPSEGHVIPLLEEREAHLETTPALSGGDLDADWQRAASSGEEGVGGSVSTPDQDTVDELGRALGVEQPPEAEVQTSEEILRTRDRHYWHLERDAAPRSEP